MKTKRTLTSVLVLAALAAALFATVGIPTRSADVADDRVAVAADPIAPTPAPEQIGDPAPERAATELDRLIDLFTDRAAARQQSLEYGRLGNLLLQRAGQRADLADYRAAVDAFSAALDLDPGNVAGMVGLGRAALGVHDFATALEATDALTRSGAVDPATNPDAVALIVDTAFAVGDYDQAGGALADLAAAVGNDPAIIVRQAELASLEPAAGNDQRLSPPRELAAQAVDEARDLPPTDLAFYQTYAGRLAFDEGDYEAATALLEQALANSPDDHGTLGELARVRAATGRIDEAIELLERANALIPEPDHLVLQGDLRIVAGQPEEAAAADYRAAVELATVDADHRRAWARSLATYLLDHDGDLDLVADIVADERALRNDPGAYDLEAWSAYRSGDLEAARASIDTALELAPPGAATWYHAAVISAAEGDTERAATELSAALATNPGFDPLLAKDAQQLASELGVS